MCRTVPTMAVVVAPLETTSASFCTLVTMPTEGSSAARALKGEVRKRKIARKRETGSNADVPLKTAPRQPRRAAAKLAQ
jgi:hypothetical protein